jgi:hypothetical protein
MKMKIKIFKQVRIETIILFSMLVLILLSITSCNAEKRIYEHSYTDYWYYEQNQRYQVYQTSRGNKYILVLNKKETKFIRKYINLK